jgi:hypothetical protein
VAAAFAHLGFPAYFRVELSWAKFLGIALLLAPVPARLKEWAYAGFAITLVSALIAHFSLGDGPEAWGWAAGTGVLWVLSYFFWRRLQVAPRERAVAAHVGSGAASRLSARSRFADQLGPLVPSPAQHEIESQGACSCDARFVGMSLPPGQKGGRPSRDRAG